MTRPTPSPCDKCPKRETCGEDICLAWVRWIMLPESQEKYMQEMMR